MKGRSLCESYNDSCILSGDLYKVTELCPRGDLERLGGSYVCAKEVSWNSTVHFILDSLDTPTG